MHYFSKIKYSVIVLSTTLLLSACNTEPPTDIKHITVTKAYTGTLMDSSRISAPALGTNVAELAFKASGRVSVLNAQIGQFFKKGEILAELSGEESQITAKGTNAILGSLGVAPVNGSLKASLKEMRNTTEALYKSRLLGMDADIASAEIRLNIAKNEENFAKTNGENIRVISSGSVLSSIKQQEQAEEGLRLAKNQLDTTTDLLGNEETNLYRASLVSLENAFVVARSAREFEDMFLGISDENRSKNDSFENYLDIYEKGKAETAFRVFDTKYVETYTWYYANVANRSEVPKTVTKEALDRAIPTLESLRESLHGIKSVLEKSIVSSTFSQSSIDSYQQQTNELLNNVEQSLVSISGGGVRANRLALDTFENTRTLKITGLLDAVRVAQKNLELLESGKDIATNASKKDIDALIEEVTVKEQMVELSKKSFESIKTARQTLLHESKAKLAELDAQIAQANVQIAEAGMQGNLAKNQMENQILRAPFDGVVSTKSADVGSVVNMGSPVILFTSNDAVHAIFSLPASISIDSITHRGVIQLSHEDGTTFTGVLVSKNTIRDAVSNTVKIEVIFSKGITQVGERIWLNPLVEGPKGVIVPTAAIITKYSIPSVYVYQNEKVSLVQVRVVRTNTTQTLVENLAPGTPIVVDGKDRLLDGEIVPTEGVKIQ